MNIRSAIKLLLR